MGRTQEKFSYLDETMNGVSRSFALVVSGLVEPLRYTLSTAYLLCRVADDIEDSGQPVSWQRERFSEFQHLLKNPAAALTTLELWDSKSWPELSAPERHPINERKWSPSSIKRSG